MENGYAVGTVRMQLCAGDRYPFPNRGRARRTWPLTELRLLGTWRKGTAMVVFADYARDRFASDTRKLWLEVDYGLNGG